VDHGSTDKGLMRMTRFVVEEPFWSLFPDVRIGVIVANGIDNRANSEICQSIVLTQAADTARALGESEISTHPAVEPWRQAYQTFGVKPSKYRSSIESLLRSAKAERLRSINPLVDLYNTVSLRHLLPCGGEDLATTAGDIRLTRAHGDEYFVPLGGDEPEPPPPGVVIYRDDSGVICSCWNWREAERTKLTEDTTDAFLCIEELPQTPRASLESACDELAGLVERYLGAKTRVCFIDRGNPVVTLD
jgi:DNA/RNA-binding domain of Phe-tRNA-synthetase-like protein